MKNKKRLFEEEQEETTNVNVLSLHYRLRIEGVRLSTK